MGYAEGRMRVSDEGQAAPARSPRSALPSMRVSLPRTQTQTRSRPAPGWRFARTSTRKYADTYPSPPRRRARVRIRASENAARLEFPSGRAAALRIRALPNQQQMTVVSTAQTLLTSFVGESPPRMYAPFLCRKTTAPSCTLYWSEPGGSATLTKVFYPRRLPAPSVHGDFGVGEQALIGGSTVRERQRSRVYLTLRCIARPALEHA
ncbi:hypothetical protein C8R45DRAFT_1003757 [Mycena sanguinolenta]|nr:hypothetical protein C8R45DRAFT_1003757 [Mycena sanguinolenta]